MLVDFALSGTSICVGINRVLAFRLRCRLHREEEGYVRLRSIATMLVSQNVLPFQEYLLVDSMDT